MIVHFIFVGSAFLLVYAYVLYPGLSWVSVLLRNEHEERDRPANGQHELPVSVLVPAHNEAGVIDSKIRNFLSLDYPAELLELVIYDDGSTDGTADLVKAHLSDRVRLIEVETRQGKSAAMNRLAAEAKYSLYLFTDANVHLESEAVQRLLEPLEDPLIGAVTGKVMLIDSDKSFQSGENLYYKLERHIQYAESMHGSVMGVDGGMYVIRREIFQSIPDDTILDDFLVSMGVMRSGNRIFYQPTAIAMESGTPSASLEFQRRTRVAAGAIQLISRGNLPRMTQPLLWGKFISHKLLRWFSPLLMVSMLLANAWLTSTTGMYAWSLVAQLAVWGILACTMLVPWVRRYSVGSAGYYFAISQIAMALGLWKGCWGVQSTLWTKHSR